MWYHSLVMFDTIQVRSEGESAVMYNKSLKCCSNSTECDHKSIKHDHSLMKRDNIFAVLRGEMLFLHEKITTVVKLAETFTDIV